MKIDLQYVVDFLVSLVNIPSPSGNTEQVIQFIEAECARLGVENKRNNKGGLILSVPGKNNDVHRVLTAHVDTLGAMVKEIKGNGRLKLTLIGGFAFNAIEGEYCTVETADGKLITGTIQSTHASVHVHKDTRTHERNADTMEVRLDAVVKTADDVRELGIEVGDFVSFNPRCEVTETGFIKTRHLDDKASVACMFGALKSVLESGEQLPYTTHFLISNNEEIGYGANSNIPPQTVEFLAIDMGAIGDGQTTDEYCVSICAKDSSGPYHYGMRKHLVELAKANGLNYAVDIYPFYGSDASAAMSAGVDVKHGLIGPGIDASHSMERTHKSSFENSVKLIVAYLQSDLVK
ncbi:putative aminopeptidase FrvX [Tumebacillus sp. BK434]|uniref:M42 family metallopeptidase n=1 Tax=Tumebacillus sp. BK434 TaxID=2512169 RepID=UPI0010479EC2|nr:M42 family metallopeptidase [Tumebacillus sp. BK434]TCP55623.1 putative aminopeptidase FrvX [Tumebacillus sp. BK434]